MSPPMIGTDFERCYRTVQSRDARFDGWFFTAVTSTGIYCRPSCPAMTPKAVNVRFYPTAAAAQAAGFRACRRCRPDATPGSPEWNVRADLVGRAMRLIADGVVDTGGVAELARRLGYSERHLNRQLTAEVGAGPIALARAQRAQSARVLIETTELPFARVAFAAGFSSIRQFNDTIRQIFATTPSDMRTARKGRDLAPPGVIVLRLPCRAPFDGDAVVEFLAARAVPGIEEVVGTTYRRTLRLAHGAGVAELTPQPDHVRAVLRLDDLRDLTTAVQRCRRVFDLDADPQAVAEQLGADRILGRLVAKTPGLRLPGTVDGFELATRAVLGQQVSLAAARTLAARLVASHGAPLATPDGGLTHLFPQAEAIVSSPPEALGMPAARRTVLTALATAVSNDEVVVDAGADRAATTAGLLDIRGVGPWTAAYIAMRGLGDPDVFLPTDLGVRNALERMDLPTSAKDVAELAEPWRPWRSYAVMHLWRSL
jgi:AraC family transcriptional regulator, regulatory protein of adaptative response / DNA-3-methyladenine glycosylase II